MGDTANLLTGSNLSHMCPSQKLITPVCANPNFCILAIFLLLSDYGTRAFAAS